jgi:dolichol-phosphate mannosyltransferase
MSMAVKRDSALGRIALAERRRPPWLRITLSPRWARILIAAGARPSATTDDSMTIRYAANARPSANFPDGLVNSDPTGTQVPAKSSHLEPSLGHIAVIIPTYNERENLEAMVGRVRASVPEADLLVVDDNSPDGTGDLADKLAAWDAHIFVMHRYEKNGMSGAYIAGFRWALEQGYDAIVAMDADGSHQPEQLPALLEAATRADVVLGSRWVPGGRVVNWLKSREMLSRNANKYTQLILGIKVKDTTSGFRVYRATALRQIALDEVKSQGYAFQVDMTLRVIQAGLTVTEVPITFVERRHGASKMSRAVIFEAFWRLARWGLVKRLHRRNTPNENL